MSELDQLGVENRPAAANLSSAMRSGLLRGAFVSLREKWRSRQHRAPVLFTVSSLVLSVAQLLSGVVIVHYIDPRDVGMWYSAALALTYAFFVLAGVQNGLSRELPYYLGANNEDMARRLAATTLFYTLGGCVLALLGGIGTVAFLIWKHADFKLTYAVAAVTLLVAFKFYQNYLFVTFRSKNSFVDLARVQMWQAALMIGGLLFLFWGYGGLLLRFVVVAGLSLYLMHRARPMSVLPSWRTDSFMLLIKTGTPIFATDYIFNCAATADKMVLLKFGGVEQVGLYALAVSAFSAFQVVPQSIAHYAYPRMSHHYGRTNNPHVLWGMAWKTSLIVVASMLPIAVLGCWLLPFGVRFVFPKYIAGTHAAQIALFTAVAYGATMGSNALSSLKAWSHLVTYQAAYSALLVVGPLLGVRLFSSPLDGVAYGMLVANLLGAILALGFTYTATYGKLGRPLTMVPVVPLPSAKPDSEVAEAAVVK
jgi:O-antigen/teichoic acid export membrane protein